MMVLILIGVVSGAIRAGSQSHVCAQVPDQEAHRRNATAGARAEREGADDVLQAPLRLPHVQDLQGREIRVHAHGGLPRWGSLVPP